MSIASLAMYPFADLRESYDELWDAVRARLSFEGPPLEWNIGAEEACRRDDLLIGQTCGWPLVTELADSVHVVGTFDFDVEGAVDGTYRSVIVGGADEPLVDVLSRPQLIVAANGADSLSGWISMQAVAKDHGVRLDRVDWTGSHAASVDAVRVGVADIASIDAVSWEHLDARGLFVVGHGPVVPCLPVVTAQSSSPGMVAELRAAFATAVADPMLAGACASLKIRSFAARDLADYKGLSALAQLG